MFISLFIHAHTCWYLLGSSSFYYGFYWLRAWNRHINPSTVQLCGTRVDRLISLGPLRSLPSEPAPCLIESSCRSASLSSNNIIQWHHEGNNHSWICFVAMTGSVQQKLLCSMHKFQSTPIYMYLHKSDDRCRNLDRTFHTTKC